MQKIVAQWQTVNKDDKIHAAARRWRSHGEGLNFSGRATLPADRRELTMVGWLRSVGDYDDLREL
jgi:hypothetical protein